MHVYFTSKEQIFFLLFGQQLLYFTFEKFYL